ncbi:hypothetical protein M404DRAFT_991235 [Pisolithus tinctorius Marx 270]|uniref:Uncharacterized protein n=1 Tax=Pisolithus tinctorius Marx 270 TaxID=870435 RepID=A0A0C3JZA0_PISTI|nr:hypothetical protein M404DRAFT_991235 [Pisolithus tinctorius Marx 270]
MVAVDQNLCFATHKTMILHVRTGSEGSKIMPLQAQNGNRIRLREEGTPGSYSHLPQTKLCGTARAAHSWRSNALICQRCDGCPLPRPCWIGKSGRLMGNINNPILSSLASLLVAPSFSFPSQ